MVFSLLLAAAATLTPTTTPLATPVTETHQIDAGYDQLAAGENEAAIERLRNSLPVRQGDPAALINLGAAYARTGDQKSAADSFRAAIASPERYKLELADGSWMDSRGAAQLALARLGKAQAFAAR